MEIPELVFYGLASAFLLCFVLLKWNYLRYNRKGMPPGTMGWPIVGETATFLKEGPDFMRSRRTRYGNLFKTHALGAPTVVCMDPETNRFILTNEDTKGLVPGYPEAMTKILGEKNIASVHGSAHKHLRGALLYLAGPPAVRDHLMASTDRFIKSFLDNWAGKTIDLQARTKEMAFVVSMRQIVEDEPVSSIKAFKSVFDSIVLGTLSLAINFPGTNYYRGLKAKEKVHAIIRGLLGKRRALSQTYHDMLDLMLRDEDFKYQLTDEEIIDEIVTLLNSGYETVSITSMMAVKYLHDHPKALEELREEHLAIKERKQADEPFNWEHYKSMVFTRGVILETLRLANVVNGVMRMATQDVELNGYLIPKGWKIYVYTRETNADPILYPEPFNFNPWRWLGKGLESHEHNMLFGVGTRVCPGKELGLVKLSLFLHYFVTRYRWEEVEGNKLVKFPRVEAPNGLHIKLSNYR